MKRIGLIGGMSHVSTLLYLESINEKINEHYKRLSSGNILTLMVNFENVQKWMHEGKWSNLSHLIIQSAIDLTAGGADIIGICCNSAHKVADKLLNAVNVPFIHIGQPVSAWIKNNNLSKVGLIGNKFTMEDGFFQAYLKTTTDVEVITPTLVDRNTIHRIIYEELCFDIINSHSSIVINDIINRLCASGAEGIILGCTELPKLIHQNEIEIDLFNTTEQHAVALADYSIKN